MKKLLNEWANEWYVVFKSNLEFKTRDMYKRCISLHINPTFEGRYINDISSKEIQLFLNQKTDQGLTKTVKDIRLTLKQIFDKAIIEGYVKENPVLPTKIISSKSRKKRRAFTDNENTKIKKISYIDGMVEYYILLLFSSGLRKGEALALQSSDFDFMNNVIHVNKQLVYENNKPRIKEYTKTEAGMRDIPILHILRDRFMQYCYNRSGLLFVTQQGGLVTDSCYKNMIKKFHNYMNSTELTAHYFRHNFATQLYHAGVPLKEAQKIMGHEDVTTLLNIYTHLSKISQKTINKLDNHFLSLD